MSPAKYTVSKETSDALLISADRILIWTKNTLPLNDYSLISIIKDMRSW